MNSRERMEINNHEEILLRTEEFHILLKVHKVVSKMRRARGLNTSEDAHNKGDGSTLPNMKDSKIPKPKTPRATTWSLGTLESWSLISGLLSPPPPPASSLHLPLLLSAFLLLIHHRHPPWPSLRQDQDP